MIQSKIIWVFKSYFFRISIPSSVKNPQKFLIGARVVEIVGKEVF